jgi:DNA-nicking Smr family endonuclease
MSRRLAGLAGLKELLPELEAAAQKEALARREAERVRQKTSADQAEFRLAMQDVAPLKTSGRRHLPSPPPRPIAAQRLRDEKAALSESLSDEFNAESLLETDDKLSWRREGIGADVVRKLRRGHWVIGAELDLHGLRRDAARESLAQFIREAQRRGQRCVRIIHGKGLGSVARQPVLKAKVFGWLVQKEEVLALCQARAQDGGSGALVVLLRPRSVPEQSS